MYRVDCTVDGETCNCDPNWAAPLGEIVHDLRQHWLEDDGLGFPVYTVAELASGRIVAVMIRDDSDSAVSHTMYSDGSSESYRTVYELDEDGRYARSIVTTLEAV